jgi:hypothetical protein
MREKIKLYKKGEVTGKEELDDLLFKSDSLRKKYDVRNIDVKTVKSVFMKGNIEYLKQKTEEEKLRRLELEDKNKK